MGDDRGKVAMEVMGSGDLVKIGYRPFRSEIEIGDFVSNFNGLQNLWDLTA